MFCSSYVGIKELSSHSPRHLWELSILNTLLLKKPLSSAPSKHFFCSLSSWIRSRSKSNRVPFSPFRIHTTQSSKKIFILYKNHHQTGEDEDYFSPLSSSLCPPVWYVGLTTLFLHSLLVQQRQVSSLHLSRPLFSAHILGIVKPAVLPFHINSAPTPSHFGHILALLSCSLPPNFTALLKCSELKVIL